jgi:4-diphosphocytidyl-2-C-methyl-D-erythritol kinase
VTGKSADEFAPLADEAGGVCFRRETARAKVNLTLEVLGRRADGYHELRSLVAFTQFGDELSLRPGTAFTLRVEGPFAAALEGGGNLVRRAAELYAQAISGPSPASAGEADVPLPSDAAVSVPPSGAFRLIKRIPVAAGLGGGSADAAAALRLLAGSDSETFRRDAACPVAHSEAEREAGQRHATAHPDLRSVRNAPPGIGDKPAPDAHPDAHLAPLLPLAAKLGADVPACLLSRPAMMRGVGERLAVLPAFPRVPIVLVNPGLPLATAAVFRELRAGPLRPAPETDPPPDLRDLHALIDYVRPRRNDLEPPARRLLPVISAVLDRLGQCQGALLVRLSGSGPTCFALFRAEADADRAAAELAADQPGWWVQSTLLG